MSGGTTPLTSVNTSITNINNSITNIINTLLPGKASKRTLAIGQFADFNSDELWLPIQNKYLTQTRNQNTFNVAANVAARKAGLQGVLSGLVFKPLIYPDINGEIEVRCGISGLNIGASDGANTMSCAGLFHLSPSRYLMFGLGREAWNADNPRLLTPYVNGQELGTFALSMVASDSLDKTGAAWQIAAKSHQNDPNTVDSYTNFKAYLKVDAGALNFVGTNVNINSLFHHFDHGYGVRFGIGFSGIEIPQNQSATFDYFEIIKGAVSYP